jgi:hypothetical protein
VWSTNVPPGNEHYWVLPDGTEVSGDSIQVDTTGNYTFIFDRINSTPDSQQLLRS